MATVRYIRVSSIDQNTDRQYEALPDTDKTFEEKASAATAKRPQLEAMLDYIREGDTVFVHSIDRLARNIVDLHNLADRITDKGCKLVFIKENMQFGNGPNSKMSELLFSILGAFAQFERSMIKERQAEGIAAAQAKGKRFGRKPKLNDRQKKEIRDKRKAGANPTQLAKEYGVSRALVYNVIDPTRTEDK